MSETQKKQKQTQSRKKDNEIKETVADDDAEETVNYITTYSELYYQSFDFLCKGSYDDCIATKTSDQAAKLDVRVKYGNKKVPQ